ncbi:hypothetical protein JW710_03610 [Candidatus Dojkabacteria bacterium]|nr:hypothetical protein [Candidatus Dojkabacteria bacterium]
MYDCSVSRDVLSRLFGEDSIEEFCDKNSEFCRYDGFVGRISPDEVKKRKKNSEWKLQIAEKYFKYFRFIPWVKFAAVCGSVSFMTAEENDDIDVFVIVQRNRLWLVRLMEQIIFRLLGVRRRYSDKDVNNKMCFVYYTSFENLKKTLSDADFYVALEVAMMKPLYGKSLYGGILGLTDSITSIFPGLSDDAVSVVGLGDKRTVFSPFLDILDRVLMWGQKAYMIVRKHPYKEAVISRNEVQFFPRSSWFEIRKNKLDEKLQSYDLR